MVPQQTLVQLTSVTLQHLNLAYTLMRVSYVVANVVLVGKVSKMEHLNKV